jgi:hypothetical protein
VPSVTDREDPAAVYADFRAFLNDMAGAQGHARGAVAFHAGRMLEIVGSSPPPPENPDPTISLGIGDPNDPSSREFSRWKLSELREKLAFTEEWIGLQWIVGTYTGWELEYRPRLATAYGCDAARIAHDAFGDLRLMRNDVIHHRGIATADKSGRCVMLQWFRAGDTMRVRDEQVLAFMDAVPEMIAPKPNAR